MWKNDIANFRGEANMMLYDEPKMLAELMDVKARLEEKVGLYLILGFYRKDFFR